MKRLASQLSLILAALAATPAALAGADVLKCVDNNGRVTLTDQPCGAHARTERLTAASALNTPPEFDAATGSSFSGGSGTSGTVSSGDESLPPTTAVQRYAAPPAMVRQHEWRPQVPQRSRPLARDVATMKAARAQLLLLDSERQPRPHLATID